MFNKSIQSAISAMTLLAEVYDQDQIALTSQQIADDRELPKPFAAKLLTALSQGGLVKSKPGRNGGFYLARPPKNITLLDIAVCVGYKSRLTCCLFSPHYGEGKTYCPLHQDVADISERMTQFMKNTTLDGFYRSKQKS